jgi:hypothetical protein
MTAKRAHLGWVVLRRKCYLWLAWLARGLHELVSDARLLILSRALSLSASKAPLPPVPVIELHRTSTHLLTPALLLIWNTWTSMNGAVPNFDCPASHIERLIPAIVEATYPPRSFPLSMKRKGILAKVAWASQPMPFASKVTRHTPNDRSHLFAEQTHREFSCTKAPRSSICYKRCIQATHSSVAQFHTLGSIAERA